MRSACLNRVVILVLVSICGGWLPAVVSEARADFARDAAGWTRLAPSADSRVIHVSNAGSDVTGDGTLAKPYATIGRGQMALRNNFPDWLVLKSGDTFNISSPIGWEEGGRSAAEPMVFGSYGDGARPIINSGSNHALTMWGNTFANSNNGYNNIVVKDLHLKANTWSGAKAGDNPVGIRVDRAGSNLLFENLYVEGYASNVVVQSVGDNPLGQNVQVRRSVLIDAFAKRSNDTNWNIPGEGTNEPGYEGGSHAQGLYGSRLNGLLIEENVFDRNGWNPDVEGAERTIFNHNLYIQNNNQPGSVTVRGNIIANGAATGVQLRPGGVIEDNLFIGNSIAAFIGSRSPLTTGGRAEGNVFIHGSRDTILANAGNFSGPRTWGLDMLDFEDSEALYNLFLHTPGGTNALTNLDGVDVEGNIIYGWGNRFEWDANLYDGEFLDPDRTIASYDQMIGGDGSIASFIERARTLSRDNWDLAYTAGGANPYFFEGFSVPEPGSLALVGLGLLGLLRRPRRLASTLA